MIESGRCVKKWRCYRFIILFNKQAPSPFTFSAASPSFSCLSSAASSQMDLAIISWTLLRDLKVIIKHECYPALTGLITINCTVFSHFKKECNETWFTPIELNNIKMEWKVDCWNRIAPVFCELWFHLRKDT